MQPLQPHQPLRLSELPMASPLVLLLLLVQPAATVARPQVVTTSGTLQGTTVATERGVVSRFLGVRYAQPPVGDRRFRAAEKLTVDDAGVVVDTSKYAPSCMQPPHLAEVIYPQLLRNHSHVVSEDCLFLNVFVPEMNEEKKSQLPVMMWVAGEGYSFAMSRHYDATRLAQHGVIVVTLDYRVSAFGFLATGDDQAPGNAGITDIAVALTWLRENIAHFGGDRDSITVFGRFTGAMSITALLASPLAQVDGKPLFQRAILQSGIAGDEWTVDRHPLVGAKRLARHFACATDATDMMMACLRNVSAERLNEVALSTHSWRLVIDENTLSDEPLRVIRNGKHLPVPIMVGVTNDEGSICLFTHHFLKTKYNDRIHDGSLTETDFDELLSQSVTDHFGHSMPDVVEEASDLYKSSTDSTNWRDRYLQLCGDLAVHSRTLQLSRLLSTHGSRVFLYRFTHRPSQSFFPDFVRAAHGDDILFSFGFIHDNLNSSVEEKELADAMMTAFTHFAAKGDPNPMLQTSKEWQSFSVDKQKYWEFSASRSERRSKSVSSGSSLREVLWQRASNAAHALHHHHHHHNQNHHHNHGNH